MWGLDKISKLIDLGEDDELLSGYLFNKKQYKRNRSHIS